MKIAYVVSVYPAQSHTFIQREIEGMRANGLEIVTYSIRRPPPWDILGEAARAEAVRTRWLVPPPVVDFALAMGWAVLTRPIRLAKLAWVAMAAPGLALRERLLWACYLGEAVLLAYWVAGDKADHLHCHFGNSGSNTAWLAARLINLPFSISFHGIDLDEPERHRHAAKVREARFAVCISQFGKALLMQSCGGAHGEKIHVVHCGQAIPETPGLPAPNDNRIVCVARLSPEKGHFVLLDALAELRARGVAFHCTLVGDGPVRAQLEARVRELDLATQITFAGAQPPAEVAKAFDAADVGVLASFGEGIPVVIMEAFLHRRPVVATRVGGIPELIDNGVNGWLVEPGDAKQLADALERVLLDHEAAAAMGARGFEKVSAEFRDTDSAAQLAALFRGGESP